MCCFNYYYLTNCCCVVYTCCVVWLVEVKGNNRLCVSVLGNSSLLHPYTFTRTYVCTLRVVVCTTFCILSVNSGVFRDLVVVASADILLIINVLAVVSEIIFHFVWNCG